MHQSLWQQPLRPSQDVLAERDVADPQGCFGWSAHDRASHARGRSENAHFGKYHHEVEKTITLPYHPEFLEFDEFFGFEAMSNYFRQRDPRRDEELSYISYRVGKKNIDYQFPKEGAYLTDTLTELGVDYINRCAAEKQPFFLYLPYNAPHAPIQAREEDLHTLFPKPPRTPARARRSWPWSMPWIGESDGLSIRWKRTGNWKHTLILFTGDNGGERIFL